MPPVFNRWCSNGRAVGNACGRGAQSLRMNSSTQAAVSAVALIEKEATRAPPE
jgi:hypothetical protein